MRRTNPMQSMYYRALYEKNLSKLIPKGKRPADGPSLMNVAMELRKCCNHPFLLRGVREETFRNISAPTPAEVAYAGSAHLARARAETDALVATSGKLVFLDKLLPKLQMEGHRVLIFSQFKIMLDLLEDFLEGRCFSYERLDGDVTGTDRQACIDRCQAKDSTSFIMLLSTRRAALVSTLWRPTRALFTIVISIRRMTSKRKHAATASGKRSRSESIPSPVRQNLRNEDERESFPWLALEKLCLILGSRHNADEQKGS